MRFALPVMLLFLLTASCKRDLKCREPQLSYDFSEFDSSELLLVRQVMFEKGSHFQKVAFAQIGSSSIVQYKPNNDTLPLGQIRPSTEYDQILFLTYADNRQYRIGDIVFGSETQKEDALSVVDEHCALSCTVSVNDSLVHFSAGPLSQNPKEDIIHLNK